MSIILPTVRTLAEQLFAIESSDAAIDTSSDAAVRVCEKLRVVLTRLTGEDGFATLLRRAVALSRADHPELESVLLKDDQIEALGAGIFESNGAQSSPLETIVMHLIELLIEFVGETLTRRLIQDAWPEQMLEMQEGEGPGNDHS